MSSRLETKDPVFAAYLIFRGCKLLTIYPCNRATPKKYFFEWSEDIISYEAEFLGATEHGVKTTWLDFKNRMDNLQAKEDRLFRYSSTLRIERNGEENWLGQRVFVTSSQPIAAFLLSKGLQMFGASEIRIGNHLFAFLDHEKASALTLEMLDGTMGDSWYEMKTKYKHATALRNNFCRPRRQVKKSYQVLKASGTNG